MPTLDSTDVNIKYAASVIQGGGVVAFPTETVYGLGASVLNENAAKKIFEIKGRPSTNPLIVHLGSTEQLFVVAEPFTSKEEQQLARLEKFWPGPLSVILRANASVPKIVTAGLSTVAVRIPSHPIAQKLIKESGVPIAAPSANRSGYVSPTTAQHVDDGLGHLVDIILDGGPCSIGLESTIVSLVATKPTLLRAGSVTAEELRDALGDIDVKITTIASSVERFIAPGQLKEHYAPTTPIILRGTVASSSYPRKVGLIAFCDQSDASEKFDYSVRTKLSNTGDRLEIAQRLFSALRDFDKRGLDLIVVDTCDASGLGLAIMDRLERATARSQINV